MFKTGKFNIKIAENDYHKSLGFDESSLTLLFSGNDVNIKMINALRRVSYNNLPMYAFPPELIKIETNTMVAFNNDNMRLYLSQLPVAGIDSKLFTMQEKYWYGINYADQRREKHPNEQSYELYINAHNTTDKIIPVTTNDALVYIDGEQIKPYSQKYPLLLAKLRPDDKFKCSMKAVLGLGERHAIWKGASTAYYDELIDGDKKSYVFSIESNYQCSEYELLIRSCKFLIRKLSELRDDLDHKIKSGEIKHEKMIYFKLEQDDHTIGEIINYEFQDHKDILGSGVSRPDHLVKAILIKIQCVPNLKSPLNAMLESLDLLINKYRHIGKLFVELNKGSDITTNSDILEKKSVNVKQIQSRQSKDTESSSDESSDENSGSDDNKFDESDD